MGIYKHENIVQETELASGRKARAQWEVALVLRAESSENQFPFLGYESIRSLLLLIPLCL